ncbi:hypothetical protein M409DRAFT_26614 [Zasmidium cellare ATCC 36951]|uniref:FAD-binding domain-containing protein n=1 Tax=Zasmidium cellare ATCC 36951 TaxID=1080233 RepID=A0A6A6C821_ZASCE|nr:uncharacterized protein M409DRAFT_26614 [Zasmidium cellare ATCC 36951]KAF2163171.1 hypothetical protein M409DRAFT_26614 [Zasmidium cellare ATCC 36951]
MADQSSTNSLHVLINGAGTGGLLLAQGLKKRGISFEVFEQEESASQYRAREWGMSVQWALPMLPDLLPPELLGRLQETSVDPHYIFPKSGNSMPVYDGSSGELLKDIPLVEMIRVSRNKMRALCAEGINIQYSKEFRTLRTLEDDPVVTAHFTDNTTFTGALIVAADGANSDVRQAIFPSGQGASQQVPYGGVNMHVKYNDASIARFLRKSLSPIQAIGVHPKGYWLWLSVQEVPEPDKPEDWTFQLQWTWKMGPDTTSLAKLDLEKLRAEAEASFADPFKTAWTKIPSSTRVSANRISTWPPQAVPADLFQGKVALLGDAAHPMTFHRGQGMNHGIADAVKLANVLDSVHKGEKTLTEAVKEYEDEMIKRSGEEVKISKMNTEMMHDWEKFLGSPFMQRGGNKN